MKISSNDVFKKLRSNKSFSDALNDESASIFKGLVEDVLAKFSETQFDEVLTIESVCNAKVIVLETACNGSFIADLCKATGQDEFADLMKETMIDMVGMIKPIISNASSFMEEHDVTISGVYKEMGMSEETLKLCEEGSNTGVHIS